MKKILLTTILITLLFSCTSKSSGNGWLKECAERKVEKYDMDYTDACAECYEDLEEAGYDSQIR